MQFERQIFQFRNKPHELNKNQELYFGYLSSGTSVYELNQSLLQQGWLISFVDLILLLELALKQRCFNIASQAQSVQRLLNHQLTGSAETKSKEDRSLTLAEISFLRNLKAEIRQILLQRAYRKTIQKDQAVIKEGESNRDLFAATRGSFVISRGGKYLAQINPGVCFGEAGFFFGTARTATVLAATNSEVLVVPWQKDFKNLMNQQVAQNLQVRFWIQHALSQSNLFKDLPTECFDFLSMIGKVLRLSPGQVLIAEKTKGTNAYLIVQGEFQVYQNSQKIRQIKQGDFVGEVGLMKTGGLRTATVQSQTESLVLEIPQRDFYSMLAQNLMIGYQLEKLAHERLLADQARRS